MYRRHFRLSVWISREKNDEHSIYSAKTLFLFTSWSLCVRVCAGVSVCLQLYCICQWQIYRQKQQRKNDRNITKHALARFIRFLYAQEFQEKKEEYLNEWIRPVRQRTDGSKDTVQILTKRLHTPHWWCGRWRGDNLPIPVYLSNIEMLPNSAYKTRRSKAFQLVTVLLFLVQHICLSRIDKLSTQILPR